MGGRHDVRFCVMEVLGWCFFFFSILSRACFANSRGLSFCL